MSSKLNKSEIERFSRQIILKKIGISGQKKIIDSKVLIVGMGGLGCPASEFLVRAGVGFLGIIDSDKVEISNIHRQSLYDTSDLKKFKVIAAKKKLKKINTKTKIVSHKIRLNRNNFNKILEKYDYVVDGSDNFKTKFLVNDLCKDKKKFLVTGAINKFDGQVFTFDFKKRNIPCIRSFFQEKKISDDILNCEYGGILGTIAGIIGTMQANEILKKILKIETLMVKFLILDLLNLNFRKANSIKSKCLKFF